MLICPHFTEGRMEAWKTEPCRRTVPQLACGRADFHSSPSDCEAPICKRWGNWKIEPCIFITLSDNDNILTTGQRARSRKIIGPHQPQFLRGPTQQWRPCHLCPIQRNVQEGIAGRLLACFCGSPQASTRAWLVLEPGRSGAAVIWSGHILKVSY